MPIDAILGPGRWNIDTGVSRSFRMGGSQTLQFRWEVFNVFNTLAPSNPISVLTSPDFGKVTSLANSPRIMQLAVKYGF